MEPDESPLFDSMETERQFPQLFSVSHETPPGVDPQSVKQEHQALDVTDNVEAKVIQSIESGMCSEQTSIKIQENNAEPELTRRRRIKCPECLRYSAETEEKMARHIRKVHRGENPFQCYTCDYSTYNNVRFEEHVRKHQGIKPFKCSKCKYSSASRKNLKKHEFKHRPDYPLKCTECDFIGQHRSALLAHRKIHPTLACEIKDEPVSNEEKKFLCKICSARFESTLALKNHSKSKKKCLDCKAVLCSKKLLTLHVKVYHKDIEGKPKKNKARAHLFKCQVCDWSSSHKPKILLHLIHHPNQTVDENVVDIGILRKHGIMD